MIVILHELGHAIPAILLTRQPVTVYIGSYGKEEGSRKFSIGKLEVRFEPKMLWNNGLCVPSATEIPITHIMIYTLLGPLLPFVVGASLFAGVIFYDFSTEVTVFAALFFLIGTFDLFVNLVPTTRPTTLESGKIVYNDGQSIKMCLAQIKYGTHYIDALNFYGEGEFRKALDAFGQMRDKHIEKPNILRYIGFCQINLKQYDAALETLKRLKRNGHAEPDDYCNMGYAAGQNGDLEKSVQYFRKAIRINPKHKHSLNNIGYYLNELGRFEEAIGWLDQSIAVDPDFSYPYNNRGLAKIKLGQLDAGLADVGKSLELEADNGYAYRNIGIYHMEKREFAEARINFEKAKKIDPETPNIDALLDEAIKNA